MLVFTKVLLGSGLSTALSGPSASEVGFPVTGSLTLLSRSPGPRPEAGPCPKACVQGSASDIGLSCPERGTLGGVS